jgi:hypothetical protein
VLALIGVLISLASEGRGVHDIGRSGSLERRPLSSTLVALHPPSANTARMSYLLASLTAVTFSSPCVAGNRKREKGSGRIPRRDNKRGFLLILLTL